MAKWPSFIVSSSGRTQKQAVISKFLHKRKFPSFIRQRKAAEEASQARHLKRINAGKNASR